MAFTNKGLAEGGCDDYGGMEDAALGNICVCKINWDDDDIVPGVPLHECCWRLIKDDVKDYTIPQLFKVLGDKIGDCDQNVEGVDYGAILENQAQDYELNSGQQWMVTYPFPIIRATNVHKDSCGTPPGDFSALPQDVMLLLLDNFEVSDILNFGATCKENYRYSRHEAIWEVEGCVSMKEGTTIHVFESDDAMKNFQRIRGLIRQIVAVLPPPSTIEAPEAPEAPVRTKKRKREEESDEDGEDSSEDGKKGSGEEEAEGAKEEDEPPKKKQKVAQK
jgi:hypothetical protein